MFTLAEKTRLNFYVNVHVSAVSTIGFMMVYSRRINFKHVCKNDFLTIFFEDILYNALQIWSGA